MATHKPKHILIAPLDWGLGHTTRCVPLIRYILSLGHVPVVAANASQRAFIEETFGNIDIIHLEGYNILYSKWNRLGQIGLLSQMPGILKTISAEHKWLLQLCDNRQIDGIISDNRYGLFHPSIPSAILTHQLQVQSGMGNVSDHAVQKLHYRYLNRFHATWVVDTPGTPNLAGKLSHPAALPNHAQYLGLLSQFDAEHIIGSTHLPQEKIDDDVRYPDLTTFKKLSNLAEGNVEKPVTLSPVEPAELQAERVVILLSGPEPQRTTLSRILWQQVQQYKGKVTFIEGSEKAIATSSIPTHITYHKRLTNKQLTPILRNAGIIICRSGYSTLMDLIALRKKAILIPTPGQTEQEYLASHLHGHGIFYCAKQNGFDLQPALKGARQFPFHSIALDGAFDSYKKVVDKWVETL